MKGKILDFSLADDQGLIAGDDGSRYTFIAKEWKSSTLPQAGMRVDYESEGRTALGVYVDQTVATPTEAAWTAADRYTDDFYRSSDDRMVAGVCAGLAHKWHVSRDGLRVATVLATLFFGLPFFVYVVCWVLFPARPTKEVG